MAKDIRAMEERMQKAFDNTMDEAYLKFHTHPTSLTHIGLTDAEIAEMVYNDAMGRNLADNLSASGKKDKRVHHHGDRDHSNGLPRRR